MSRVIKVSLVKAAALPDIARIVAARVNGDETIAIVIPDAWSPSNVRVQVSVDHGFERNIEIYLDPPDLALPKYQVRS